MTALKDYLARRENRREALKQEGATREQLLEELRQTLRDIRETLPTYKRVQETRRYRMTLEDIEDHEQRYAQLAKDPAGIHNVEDYIEALIDAQDTSHVITHVLTNYGNKARPHGGLNRKFSTWWLVGAFLLALLLMRACGTS